MYVYINVYMVKVTEENVADVGGVSVIVLKLKA